MKCIDCGNDFTPVNANHKRCGSKREKTGCTYKLRLAQARVYWYGHSNEKKKKRIINRIKKLQEKLATLEK